MRTARFRTHGILHLLILYSLIFTTPVGYAQESQSHVRQRRVSAPGEAVGPGEVVRIDTDLVPIEVTVRDAKGRYVQGLRSSDFRIFEDEVERPVSFFSEESQGGGVRCPLDLVFALDVSGSMKRNEMEMLRRASATFTERLSGQRSQFAVITFGLNVKLLQSFTDDQRKLDRAFDVAAQDQMGFSTHAYDAVDDAVRLLVRRGRKKLGGQVVKRAVIVITDGFPTGDTVSPRTVIERANFANVSIYSVTVPSFPFNHSTSYRKPLPTIFDLSGLVVETGGVSVYATGRNYAAALKAIGEEVLSRYVLAFYPSKEKRHDGKHHKLRIEAPSGLTVSPSRRGYAGQGLR